MAFSDNTRQTWRQQTALTYASGLTSSYQMSRVGIIGAIRIHVNGVMTVTPGTGTVALSEFGPHALARRLRFRLNSGTEVYNTTGFGNYLVQLRQKLGYDPKNGQTGGANATDIYAAGVATGANTWNFDYFIPIQWNDRDEVGLILLQSEGLTAQLEIDWQPGGGPTHDFPVVTTGNATATFVGTAAVYAEVFTTPAAAEDLPPLNTFFQTQQFSTPITNTGENFVQFQENNTYVRIIHAVTLNGSMGDGTSVDRFNLRYNMTDNPYDWNRQSYLPYDRYRYARDMPPGVFVHEFFDQGYPNFGGGRDLIDGSQLADLRSTIYINSGATLGANNNVVDTIYQWVVPITTGQ